jgi:cell division protein FtsI (penicillin-binding protein 3)
VFKEIAERVYSYKVLAGEEELEEIEQEDRIVLADIKKGSAENIEEVVDELDVKHVKGSPDTDWANVEVKDDKIYLTDNEIIEGTVPNVKGMGATSAVYLLESAGLRVIVSGIGRVKKQSINPGSKFKPGQTVFLTLG